MSIRDPPVTGTAPVTAGPATAWMAPELLTGGSTTTSSDIYALGVTIWEILTKATPYESLEVPSPKNLPPDTVAAIVNQGLRPAIPGDMADAVRALLERCWDQVRLTVPLGLAWPLPLRGSFQSASFLSLLQDPSRRPSIVEVADVLSAEKSAAPMVIARTNTQQSRSLLHQVLPPHVAAALEQGRKVVPRPLYCDCSGPTSDLATHFVDCFALCKSQQRNLSTGGNVLLGFLPGLTMNTSGRPGGA